MTAPAPSRWDLAAAGVLVATTLGHVVFILRDGRIPTDMGLTWQRLPAVHAALVDGGPWPSSWAPGLWSEALVAMVLALAGPHRIPLQLIDGAWLLLLLVAIYGLTRHLSGPRAAAGAVAVAAMLPAVVLQARWSWVHVPEAALALTLTLAWLTRSGLRSPVVAVVGALVLSLRPSALVWMLPLAAVERLRPPGPRLSPAVFGAWAVGALPSLWVLPGYVTAKLEARERYLQDVPGLLAQLPDHLGGPGTLLVVLGLLAAVPALRARRRSPGLWLLAAWVLLPLALFLGSRAGLDNFTVAFGAVAVLVGIGLDRHPALALGALAGWLVFTIPQHLPVPDGTLAHLASAARLPVEPRLRNVWRPYHHWTGTHFAELVAATCSGTPCVVATDQGLLRPDGEEPGALERFLMDAPQLGIHSLRTPDTDPTAALHAIVHYDCPELEGAWRRRYPHSLDQYRAAVSAHSARVVWKRVLDPQCTVYWLTPEGRLADPARLPPSAAIQDDHPPHLPSAVPTLESARKRPGRRRP